MTKQRYKYNKNHHLLPKRKVILEKLDWRRNRVQELQDDILSMRNNTKLQITFLVCFSHGFREY